MEPELSIIVPAYNEGLKIGSTIERIISYTIDHGIDAEVIIANDGSTDDTARIVKEAQSTHKNVVLIDNISNAGKGKVIRDGMLTARGNYAIYMDADLSTPITELGKLLEQAGRGYEVVIGSRRKQKDSIKKEQVWYRRVAGNFFHNVIVKLFIRGIHDTQCSFKLFSRNAYTSIFRQAFSRGFVFDIEILILANLKHFDIVEVPVVWYDDEDSRLMRFRHIANMLHDLVLLKTTYSRRSVKKLATQ